jgi:hypothetical protein
VALASIRAEKPTPAAEIADLITVLGNQFTINTYQHCEKPIYRLQISVPQEYLWADDKDFEACAVAIFFGLAVGGWFTKA